MREVLVWLGSLLMATDAVGVGASAAATMGTSPSLNLGDPSEFQFIQ
jgi:hypothetical protein